MIVACSRLSVFGDERKPARKEGGRTKVVLPYFFSRSPFFSLPTTESLKQANMIPVTRTDLSTVLANSSYHSRLRHNLECKLATHSQ